MIFVRLIITIGLVSDAPAALAESASAQAEALFEQGRQLMAAGNFAEACAAFEASQKLEAAVTTQLNLGGCREKNNQLASAWGVFVDVQRVLRDATNPTSQQLAQLAEKRAAALAPRLSKLTVTVVPDRQLAGLELFRGSEMIDPGAWNLPLPIDGGTYKIVARAPGHDQWSTMVTVKPEGDVQTVEMPVLAATKVVAAPVSEHRSRVLEYAVGGGGVALSAVGFALELVAERAYNKAKAEMTDNTRRQSLYNTANTEHHVAQGLAVAGLGAAGVAIWLYIRGRHDERAARIGRLEVAPIIAADRSGLFIQGGF
jgi:tetratricopeptide (TPR) repeat protein